ncbi:substrate-binding and VWA domain-containing protein [Janibacter corallicola]|uniref:substrate-binding and VWA domain-containing protein n=1 Tax=Janibacter corallicola TaxID=415212 RepID=UPI000A6BCDC0|nr:substrate-binding and VWA domain-containing protein [Janibacter corallicola]
MSGEGADRPGRRHDLWDEDTPAASSGGAATTRTRGGRHGSDRRGWPWWVILLAILLVLLLCLGGSFLAFGGDDDDEASSCGEDPILVAAAPEISDALDTALQEVEKKQDCADFEVSSTDSAQAAKSINEGRAPDVWVPSSSTWIDALDEDKTKGTWVPGHSIATSPVTLAVGSEAKDAPSEVSSWGTLLREQGTLRMANPDGDTASRLAFHASRIGEPDQIGLETGKRLIFLSRFAAPSVEKLLADYEGDPRSTDPFPASEQQVAEWNRKHEKAPPLHAVVPEKGTLSLDYPWITNPELEGELGDAVDSARTELGSLEVRQALTKAGFRTSDGKEGPTIDGQEADGFEELEPLSRSERVDAVEQWDTLRTDMRMLALVDVSGSMRWDSPTPGMSRWDVTQGSLEEGLKILPDGSQVGAWVFSSERDGKKDYESIAKVARLDSRQGSQTHREEMADIVADAEELIGGDTGLYDSIWASYQKMAEDYDPDYVNSVVVFTDGENDDPTGGLSLKQLLKKLDEAYDSKKPVRVVTIGMGEADPDALQKISDETGGTSYIAETPDDIQRVFVQALLAR